MSQLFARPHFLVKALTPLSGILLAVTLSGCGHGRSYQAEQPVRMSIKDAAPVEMKAQRTEIRSQPRANPSPTVEKAVVRQVSTKKREAALADASIDAADSAVTIEPKRVTDQPVVTTKSAAVTVVTRSETSPAVTIAEKKPADIPAPVVVNQPVEAKPALLPTEPVKQLPARATTENRRQPAVVSAVEPAPKSAAKPEAPASAAPAMAAVDTTPPVAKAPASVVLQQKTTVAAAPSPQPSQPKIAAVSQDQRVRETIARANDYIARGNITNARALLLDAARNNNGEILLQLAETYDPLQLAQKYPKHVRAADATKAVDFYERAAANGAQGVDTRISALKAYTATTSR